MALETVIAYNVGTHAASMWTLTKDGKEVVKKTEFTNDNHFVTTFPFEDWEVMKWLFSNKI